MTDLPNTEAQAKIAMALRTMAQPADEGPFWQRQRERAQGRIEPMEPAPIRPWILGTVLPLGLIVGGVLLAGALIWAVTKI